MNIFESAPEAKKKANKSKTIVTLNGQDANDLDKFVEVNEKIAALTAEANVYKDSLKDRAKKEFAKLFEESKKYPGSFELESDASTFMFVPTDNYIKIDKDRFNELKDKYNKSAIVSENTTYSLDADLVSEYGQEISDAILGANIPDDVKSKLISKAVSYSITKGTIEKANDLGDVEDVIEDINPIFQLKNPKAKKITK